MKNKNMPVIVLAALCVLLLTGVFYTVAGSRKTNREQRAEETDVQTDTRQDVVTVDGKKYKRNPDIQTVLFMGVDKDARADMHHTAGENGQSDSLNLLVTDRGKKTAQVIQISRDSMVNIDIYGADGKKLMTEEGQIALQFAYGDGDAWSCRLTTEKVSELMYGIEVNGYVALTLDGLVAATDAVGGISLTVPEDYTAIDPAFCKGAEILLDGQLAEKYVRSRDIQQIDSNNQRMERQSQFMRVLIQKLQTVEGNQQYMELYQKLEPYMVTSLTADEMYALSEYQVSEETWKVPGRIIEKDGHAQYLVDNKKLQKMVLKTFYKSI